MISHLEDKLFHANGEINFGMMGHLVRELDKANDEPGLNQVLRIAVEHNPGTFEGAYALFKPVLRLLDNQNPFGPRQGLDLQATLARWGKSLGLIEARHLNAMLALRQPLFAACWLMEQGVDPNGLQDPAGADSLTILGHACRALGREDHSSDTVREMIRFVLARGDLPYSLAPRYPGDPEAQDVLDAIISDVHDAGAASGLLFETLEMLAGQSKLPILAMEAIGRVCRDGNKIAAYEVRCLSDHVTYEALSFARFPDPAGWKTGFDNVGKKARAETYIRLATQAALTRLVRGIVRDGADVDDVTVYVTDDRIPCTLLQAAALAGNEIFLKQLIDAGADPSKTVEAGSTRYPIAGLDAEGLWRHDPAREPSQALSAWKARHAIQNVLRAAGSRPQS